MGKRSPVTIRGVHYETIAEAARCLGVSRQAITMARSRGTLNTVGLPYDPNPHYMPVQINGVVFKSAVHAAKRYGVARTTIVRAVSKGLSDNWQPRASRAPLKGLTSMILKDVDISAMSNLSRWNGYVTRPYSVLEHCVIGAACIRKFLPTKDYAEVELAFLLHDAEEVLLMGDIPTPKKAVWCNEAYHTEAAHIKAVINSAAGVAGVDKAEIKYWDRVMLAAEHYAVYSKSDTDDNIENAIKLTDKRHVAHAVKLISLKDHAGEKGVVKYKARIRALLSRR